MVLQIYLQMTVITLFLDFNNYEIKFHQIALVLHMIMLIS